MVDLGRRIIAEDLPRRFVLIQRIREGYYVLAFHRSEYDRGIFAPDMNSVSEKHESFEGAYIKCNIVGEPFYYIEHKHQKFDGCVDCYFTDNEVDNGIVCIREILDVRQKVSIGDRVDGDDIPREFLLVSKHLSKSNREHFSIFRYRDKAPGLGISDWHQEEQIDDCPTIEEAYIKCVMTGKRFFFFSQKSHPFCWKGFTSNALYDGSVILKELVCA